MNPICSCQSLLFLQNKIKNINWICKKCWKTYLTVDTTNQLIAYGINIYSPNNDHFILLAESSSNFCALYKNNQLIVKINFIPLPFQNYLYHAQILINKFLSLKAFS